MDKNAIKKFAIWARNELIERVSQRAFIYGVTAQDTGDPNAVSANGRPLNNTEMKQRKALIQKVKKQGYGQVMEEVAYTWFNRFAALRFMEVNGYLPSHVRVFTNDAGEFKPQILAEAIHLELEGLDRNKVYELEEANKREDLYKYLLIVQCNALNSVLPEMFQQIEDYTELLFPDNLLRNDSVVERMISCISEDDWREQVQIIGWLYQYYNSEKKDAVFAAMANRVKVSKENIAAATQLFTPDWIVRYMVENSLGRLWVEGHANTPARPEWEYYLDEAEQTPEVQAQLAEIRAGRKDLTPEQIRFIDPCMGSGHILVYAFEVLMQIYLSCGYTKSDAAQNIVRNNLWGLDLDKRAYQLAYFAVMMKARQYDRRFLGRGIKPNLSHFQDLPVVNYSMLDEPIKSFVQQFENADTYGSLISVQADDSIDEALDGFVGTLDLSVSHIEHLMQFYKILSQRYDVVCTNPPYMAMSNANAVLKNFVEKKYPDGKADLFSAFMGKCSLLANGNGYYAMITQHTWMFLSSFEKLRKKLQSKTAINMAHLGARAFDEIGGEVVQTTAFVNANLNIPDYNGVYVRLVDENGEQEKRELYLSGKQRYIAKRKNFSKIPGAPLAYWVGDNIYNAFNNHKLIGDMAVLCQGLTTTDNNLYVRFWHEPSISNIKFDSKDAEDAKKSKIKWFPFNKGGSFKKWYGNNELVVNYQYDGSEIKASVLRKYTYLKTPDFVVKNSKYYFQKGLTWSALANDFSIRYFPNGAICADKGQGLFSDNNLYYYCALLNSKVADIFLRMVSPTLDYNCGYVRKIPCIVNETKMGNIDILVEENISFAKQDWDSFETSWDFKKHPFIRSVSTIQEAYKQWVQECDERFTKLKANEEELNRIFIDIYGLQDELTPEVKGDDVTVRKADLQRDMRSFISYAVGCLLGRYSLDTKGLAFAGGEWDESKYKRFKADKDGIIPICDDEYFNDDMTGMFIEFVKIAFGEDALEENLRFIADALGGKGSSRTVIRNYFINDFYADHCKIYQKRPIYWLFDSGKKNGFKCLIYMHRYQPDTLARIRTDYVHEQQSRYRTAIADLEQRINGASTSERVKLTRRLDGIRDQAEELRIYEEKIHHLADQMIPIDLDDGVKVNYAKFQDVLAKIK